MDTSLIETIAKCICGCCEEARVNLRHGRKLKDACYCHLYNEDQQCDCLFCTIVKNIRKQKEWIKV